MNACPNDGVLLQFLDGKLRADDDARVLAHVEFCKGCQQHLERLTAGRPKVDEPPPIETAQTDGGATVDLQSTEFVAGNAQQPATDCELGQVDQTGISDYGASPGRLSLCLQQRNSEALQYRAGARAPTSSTTPRHPKRTTWIGRPIIPEATPSQLWFRARPLPRTGQPSRATTSSSGWAKGAWGSFLRRVIAGSSALSR